MSEVNGGLRGRPKSSSARPTADMMMMTAHQIQMSVFSMKSLEVNDVNIVKLIR